MALNFKFCICTVSVH